MQAFSAVVWWRRLNAELQAAIIVYVALVILGAVAFMLYGCTFTINVTTSAPAVEVPADQQPPPAKNM